MIVLDEQLLGYEIDTPIRRWYRGTVTDLTQLRPGTSIKDDAVPELLRAKHGPTFVTINVVDFWRRFTPDRGFCIACFSLSHDRADEIPRLLRQLLALDPFKTRQRRLGKIARISANQVQYYTVDSWAVRVIELRRR